MEAFVVQATAMPATEDVQIQVPPGAQPGATLGITIGGTPLEITMPPGEAAGEVVTVQIPIAPEHVPVAHVSNDRDDDRESLGLVIDDGLEAHDRRKSINWCAMFTLVLWIIGNVFWSVVLIGSGDHVNGKH